MCGIFGYIGNKNCNSILIEGLKKLEYRGYDSVGVAISNKNNVSVIKKRGRVSSIEKDIMGIDGNIGIGHTRWATHGKPSDANAHPHTHEKFTIVHNGIIENYFDLKTQLLMEKVGFLSETDTEVIAALLSKNYQGDLLKTVKETVDCLNGSYSLAIICSDFPDKIIVTKKSSPLILGKSEEGLFISSDLPTIYSSANTFCFLEDGEFSLIEKDKLTIYDHNLKVIEKEFKCADEESREISLSTFESYMLKEITEIPLAIKKTYTYLDSLTLPEELVKRLTNCSTITILGCGTAYNAGLIGKTVIESFLRKPVNIEIASEFRYKNPIIEKNAIVIAVSQSGETADTIAAVNLAKEQGAYVVSITNILNSSLSKVSDFVIHTKAGAEIAVAATKSYNCQLICFYWLCERFAKILNKEFNLKEKIDEIVSKCQQVINNKQIISIADKYYKANEIFFLGRGIDYCSSLEASLKLKEISYIHSESYPAGELKHGTLALIENGTLSIFIITQKDLIKKTLNAVHEVKTRGSTVLVFSSFEELKNESVIDDFYLIPSVDEAFMPIVDIISFQLFSYYMARNRGCDIDKPRNLAKSVTVE